jgi:hypothetical protein
MPKQSSAIILCSKDEFEARAKRVISSTTNYKVVTKSTLRAMKKVTKIYHAKNNGGPALAKEAYDECNAQVVVIPLQWKKFQVRLRDKKIIIRSGALYFGPRKFLAFEDYYSCVLDMIQQEFSGELTKSNLEKVKTNLLKEYHMQAELLNCFHDPIEPVEDLPPIPASPLVISEDYFSNQIKSLSNERIDLTEKFKMGIQIDDSIRDKFEAALDESGIDCIFLASFSERIEHLVKSHIIDCPDEKLNESVDESFDLDRLKEDASTIFEALSAFELYEEMNQTFTHLFHCIPSTTVSQVQKTFKLRSLFMGMENLLIALKRKSFIDVLVSDLSYCLGISCDVTKSIRNCLIGGHLAEPMHDIVQALISQSVSWGVRVLLGELLRLSLSRREDFSYPVAFHGRISSFVDAIFDSTSTTQYGKGVFVDSIGNNLKCITNRKCSTMMITPFHSHVHQVVMGALGCDQVFSVVAVFRDSCRVEFRLSAKEYGLRAAEPLRDLCQVFTDQDEIKEIKVENSREARHQVIPFDLALPAVLKLHDLSFSVREANVSLHQQRNFARSCACIVFLNCTFDGDGDILLGLNGFNHERETRSRMRVEFCQRMPPLKKLYEACTKGWFQCLRIVSCHFNHEDVAILSQLHIASMQGGNDFRLELAKVKLSLEDGREYKDDILTFLSETTSMSPAEVEGGG